MADRMSRRMFVALLAFGTGCWTATAHAQALVDPTRPPGAGAGLPGLQEDAPAAVQLQSILLSRGRKVVVINGTMVPLGGMFGEARVVKITETEVVLRTGEETETLKLFPSIEKQPVKRTAGRASADAVVQGSPPRGGSSK